jgi:branched-chain amino acid aminotransferase
MLIKIVVMNNFFPQGAAWLDNKLVDISEAKIPILDWGFLRSDATYDVVHVWKGRFFLLDKHIDRFFRSAEKLNMPCKISRPKLKKILARCVKRAGLENAYVEMIQTRGVSPTFDRDPRKANPRFIAFAVPFGWILKPKDFEVGLDIAITNIRRIPPNSVDPTIKNYQWIDFVSGMFAAYDRGCHTGVLVDKNKNILEGPGFNIFSLDKHGLNTPERGVLKGITREITLNIARGLGEPINRGPISLQKLKSSYEIFVTSTAGGIMPVTKVNGEKISMGKVGFFTRKIHKIYWDRHFDSDWSCSVEGVLKQTEFI